MLLKFAQHSMLSQFIAFAAGMRDLLLCRHGGVRLQT